MLKKNFYLPILFFFFSISSFAINVNVSIYTGLNISSFSIKINSGKYSVINKRDNKKIAHLAKNDSINFTIVDNKIKLNFHNTSLGKYDSIEIKGTGMMTDFNL